MLNIEREKIKVLVYGNIDDNTYIHDHYKPFRDVLTLVPKPILMSGVMVATIIQNAGYTVDYFDGATAQHFHDKLIKHLEQKPDIICISTSHIVNPSSLEYDVSLIRKYCPQAKIVLGGAGVTTIPEMRKLGDYNLIGEGKENIISLLDAVVEKISPPKTIPGLFFYENNSLIETPPAPFSDLDSFPFPNWSFVKRTKDDFYLLTTSRGCTWGCTFCDVQGREGVKYRGRTVPSLIEEIKRNYETWGIYRYVFTDSNFPFPPERCANFLNAVIQLPFKIEWTAYGRADAVTESNIQMFKDAGCKAMHFGIETGDEKLLERMNKGTTLDLIRKSVALLRKFDILCSASWIVGFPGETSESLEKTKNFIKELNCDFNGIQSYVFEDTSPVKRHHTKFGIHGDRHNWVHESMDTTTAKDLERELTAHLVHSGVIIGNCHQCAALAGSTGMSLKKAHQLYKMAHARDQMIHHHELLNTEEFHSLEKKFYAQLLEIKKALENHPLLC